MTNYLDKRDKNRSIKPQKVGPTPLAPSPRPSGQKDLAVSKRSAHAMPDIALENSPRKQNMSVPTN